MAGGKYDKLAGKTRPGTYINFESDRNDTVGNSERSGEPLLKLYVAGRRQAEARLAEIDAFLCAE